MDDFESVYLQDQYGSSNSKRLCPLDRLKIGEVFQVRHNQFVFACIHCAQEFQQFPRFTAHIQSHYNSALHWIGAPQNDSYEMPNEQSTPAATSIENVEWLFSDSSNGSTCDDGDNNDDEGPELIDIECKVNIREDENDTEIINEEDSCELDEPTTSLEARFKLKHPLIRVKDTSDTRKLLPYFSKKFFSKRAANDERFKCPLCDYLANSKATYRRHIFIHSEMKIFSCKLCNNDFSQPSDILSHIEQKHSDVTVLTERPPKKLKIEIVEKFSGDGSINPSKSSTISPKMKMNAKMMYSAGVNGDKSRSQCLLCFKTFSRPNGIVKHMKTHTQEKNYQCFTCGSQFSRSDHLNRHMLIHEEPKFKCDICDMTFRRSDKMLIHRRKHPEAMNYACEKCGLGFMELTSIKTHVNFHCKGKPDNNESQTDGFNDLTAELKIERHSIGNTTASQFDSGPSAAAFLNES